MGKGRGPSAYEWPWGNEFDESQCDLDERGRWGTTPVGAYSPQGDSPYGCADMAGNVWEWTHTLFMPYPYRADDGREDERVPSLSCGVGPPRSIAGVPAPLSGAGTFPSSFGSTMVFGWRLCSPSQSPDVRYLQPWTSDGRTTRRSRPAWLPQMDAGLAYLALVRSTHSKVASD